jgi:hydroxyjasmonate sulfotransferase
MDSRPSPESHGTRGAAPEMAVESLPLETRWPPFPLRQYRGFWTPEITLRAGVPAVLARFTPRPSDVVLASFPKSGTTWLKALAFSALNRAAHPPSDVDHPLRRSNPHDCVRFLELEFALTKSVDEINHELEALPSPRLLATHLPHSLLPERVREVCRIVSICRDPKDTLVSSWLYTKKLAPAYGGDATAFTFQEAYDLFCEGRGSCAPQWRHVLEYWKESVSRPDKVLFLRYEEMLREPHVNLKKLAKFMECDFSKEEEERGVADAIVELCSLDTLKNVKVNIYGSGKLLVPNESFFRKGVVGDWSNHMTPEMAQRLDKIVEEALQGSGFTFNGST